MSDRLRARDWTVRSLPHGEARRMVAEWHYSGSSPNTSTYRHGLFPAELMTECQGVALWLPPIRKAAAAVHAADPGGVLSLSRLCVSPSAPGNAASFLLGASMRLIDRKRWPVLLTYADTAQGHTGAIYRATNWRCDGPVSAGDVWVMPDGSLCGRKRGPRSLTVAQMQAMGATRRPAAPKIRFVHEVAT